MNNSLVPPLKKEEKFDLDVLKRSLPPGKKAWATPDLVDDLNKVLEDPEYRENFRENILGYAVVLDGDGRVRVQDYINAVKFVSLRLLGNEVGAAYAQVFPERYKRLVSRGCTSKEIANYSAAYNRTQLVKDIIHRSLTPSWILNQDLYQKALNTQAHLMQSAKSEKVRCDAANSILMQLKMPEAAKVELDMKVTEDQSISELKKATLELAATQRQMIQAGAMNAENIAKLKIIPGTRLDD